MSNDHCIQFVLQILQSRGSMPHGLYPLDSSTPIFPYGYQSQQGLALQNGMSRNAESQFSMNPVNATLRRNSSLQLPALDGFSDASHQVPDKGNIVNNPLYILDGLHFHVLITARICSPGLNNVAR